MPGKKAEPDASADADADAEKPSAEERLAKALRDARVKVLAGFKASNLCSRTAQAQQGCADALCVSLFDGTLLWIGGFRRKRMHAVQ